MWLNAIHWKKEVQHTQSFKHLHPSILSFKQNSIVKWVEGTAHSHQNHFQAAYETKKKEQRYQILLPNIRVQEISRRYLGSHQSLKTSEGTDTLWRHLDYTFMNEREKKNTSLCFEYRKGSFLVQSNHFFFRLTFSPFVENWHSGLNLNLELGQIILVRNTLSWKILIYWNSFSIIKLFF